MERRRSVLSRAERIARLTDEGKFDPGSDSPMKLPKVAVKHSRAGQKAKKEENPEDAAAAAPKAGAADKAGAAPKAGAAVKAGAAPKAGAADKAAPKGKGKG